MSQACVGLLPSRGRPSGGFSLDAGLKLKITQRKKSGFDILPQTVLDPAARGGWRVGQPQGKRRERGFLPGGSNRGDASSLGLMPELRAVAAGDKSLSGRCQLLRAQDGPLSLHHTRQLPLASFCGPQLLHREPAPQHCWVAQLELAVRQCRPRPSLGSGVPPRPASELLHPPFSTKLQGLLAREGRQAPPGKRSLRPWTFTSSSSLRVSLLEHPCIAGTEDTSLGY